MDRLFLHVYAWIVAAVVIAAVLVQTIVLPRVTERVTTNVAWSLKAPMAVLHEEIAAEQAKGGGPDAVVARVAKRFDVPVVLVPASQINLTEASAERLARGEVVGSNDFPGTLVVAPVPGDPRVIAVGPVIPVHPYAEGRGIAAVLLLLASLLGGAHLLLRPIRRRLVGLRDAAEDLGRGDLRARVEAGPRDTIGDLADSFNRMAGEIERLVAAQEELLHMVSHELRTPLQRLLFSLEDAGEDEVPAATRQRALSEMREDLQELDDLIDELLTYARLGQEAPRPLHRATDLQPIVQDLGRTLARLGRSVRLEAQADGPLPGAIEERLARRALSNLMVNALRHAKTRVQVSAVRDGNGAVRIDVDDDGPGVPVALRARVFEPFHRLQEGEAGQRSTGFGLGLAIVSRIARSHGGTIEVLDSELGGARFRFVVPTAGAVS